MSHVPYTHVHISPQQQVSMLRQSVIMLLLDVLMLLYTCGSRCVALCIYMCVSLHFSCSCTTKTHIPHPPPVPPHFPLSFPSLIFLPPSSIPRLITPHSIIPHSQVNAVDDALRVATESANPTLLTLVYEAKGSSAAASGEYSAAESWFLRAHKADLALGMYRGARMWEDAIRVAEAHLPAKVFLGGVGGWGVLGVWVRVCVVWGCWRV